MEQPTAGQVNEFFENYGDELIELLNVFSVPTVEELYQMFKVRLMNEPEFIKLKESMSDHMLTHSHGPVW